METLLDRSKGDAVFDYRHGAEETVKSIRTHLKSGNYGEVRHGLDPGFGPSSKPVLEELVVSGGAIDIVAPSDWDTGDKTKSTTMVGCIHNMDIGNHGDARDLGLVVCR